MHGHGDVDKTDNPSVGEQLNRHQDDSKNLPTRRNKAKNVDELPDGSGTDAQGSDPDHGRETGGESFDAG